jgi:hypothetical protein
MVMKQLNIQAFFDSPTAARGIATKLRSLRALDIQLADGADTVLKAAVDESLHEQALRVIREGGGVI